MDVIKLKFNLKQITPMIHFQDELGATIRATELKPKLDRFILAWLAFDENFKCKNKNFDDESAMLESICNCLRKNTCEDQAYKNWLIDDKHCALNYKMRIRAEDKNDEKGLLDRSSSYKEKYLGNADYILKDKKGDYVSSFYNSIKVQITCFSKSLADTIIKLLPILIDSTAFGLQQSKGYGNFIVNKIFKSDEECEYIYDKESNYYEIIKQFNSRDSLGNNILIYRLDENSCNYEKALKDIANKNRIIKREMISWKFKPDFLKQKEVVNEKEAMKNCIRDKEYNIKNYTNKVYYTRGLLGFAQIYNFKIKNYNRGRPQEKTEITFNVEATCKDGKLRFPSPIHYHIAEDYKNIYLIINCGLLRQLQKLDPNIKFCTLGKNGTFKEIKAKLPGTDLFDLEDFFDNVVKRKLGKLTKLGDDKNG